MIKKVEVYRFDLDQIKHGVPVEVIFPNSSDQRMTYGLVRRAFEDKLVIAFLNWENDVDEITIYPEELLESDNDEYVTLKVLA